MIKKPSVSVVIPSYNHASFINNTLDSIFRQNVAPQKLLVIDDGSQDNSATLIEKKLNDCPFTCELIVRKNKGLSATLNEALKKTEGEYFAYLGSDDLWLPDFLDNRIKLLDASPSAVLAFGYAYLINENNEIIDSSANWADFRNKNMRSMLLKGLVPLSPSVVYRRNPLEKHGWNENSILEDYELYLKLTGEGEFILAENTLCAWRQHNSNVSKNVSLMLEEWLKAQNQTAEYLDLDSEKLHKIQEELKFNAGIDFIRAGKKMEAIHLLWTNRKGMRSLSKTAESLVRLTIPHFIFQKIKKNRIEKNIAAYGKINF